MIRKLPHFHNLLHVLKGHDNRKIRSIVASMLELTNSIIRTRKTEDIIKILKILAFFGNQNARGNNIKESNKTCLKHHLFF